MDPVNHKKIGFCHLWSKVGVLWNDKNCLLLLSTASLVIWMVPKESYNIYLWFTILFREDFFSDELWGKMSQMKFGKGESFLRQRYSASVGHKRAIKMGEISNQPKEKYHNVNPTECITDYLP